MSLLPPNATALERALEAAMARISDIAVPIDTLLDPARIRADWLPWLAWGLSVDSWDADWTEAEKRKAVSASIALHRVKGTRLAVATVLARFDQLARIVEWHETSPRGAPHSFEIMLPMVTGAGVAAGGRRSTAAFAEAIIREVARVKPLREHFRLRQLVEGAAAIGVVPVARLAIYRRAEAALVSDTAAIWSRFLQTEDGEPLQDDAGFLEDVAWARSP